MKPDKDPTIDPNIKIFNFGNNILVKCPKCEEKAISNPDKVLCSHCHFQHSVGKWVNRANGSIKGRCTYCGWPYAQSIILSNSDEGTDELILDCEKCKTVNSAIITWHAGYIDSPFDPFFALPLWLQIAVGKDILWCYNQEHLIYIKHYVACVLRPPSYSNNSLISRLPKFIKSKKNRNKIMKALSKLEKML